MAQLKYSLYGWENMSLVLRMMVYENWVLRGTLGHIRK